MECEQPDFNFGDPERSSGSEMDVVNSSVVDDFEFSDDELSNIVCNKMM